MPVLNMPVLSLMVTVSHVRTMHVLPMYRNIRTYESCAYMYVCIYTSLILLTDAQINARTCIHACIHTYVHTHLHTYIHPYIHQYVHLRTPTYAPTPGDRLAEAMAGRGVQVLKAGPGFIREFKAHGT